MNRFEFYKNLDEFKGTRSETFLQHYGILGQKWGTRRWQNPDGTFNTEGKIRYFGSKKAQAEMNDEKVGGLFNKKAINENGEEYNPKYQNRDGSLTWEGRQLSEKKATKKINSEMLEDYENKKSEREEQERIEQEAKENKVKEILNNARSDVKIKKELQNKDISDKELENIINDIDSYSSWKYWDELEKNNRNEFNKIADLGLDALARSSKYYSSDDDIGDDGWREWFMYEDQTIGLPQLTKLYYDGYSKDYINKMIDKVSSISYEDYENKYGEDSSAKFFVDQTDWQNQNKKFVEALFNPEYNAKDQKISGLFSKDENKKAEKKAAKEAKKINNELEETFKYDQGHEDEVMDSYILESEFAPLFTELRQSNNQKLDKEYKRTEEIFEDFEKNQVNNFATAGITNFLDSDSNDKSMSDLVGYVRGYIFGDANQGYANAESLYTKYDKNIDPKEIDDLYQKLHVKNDLYDENIQYLKDNNKTLSKVKDEYLRKLVEENDEGWINKATKSDLAINSYWDLYNAADDSKGYDNNLKNKYKEAKSISSKLSKSCGNDELGWNLLNLALLNLGLDRTNYKDITSSDWNKINKEISDLKEEYKEIYED